MTAANSNPRPTTGSYFSDFLICPQRAWLQYYGNIKEQVKDPAYLRALQQEGLDYERFIYKKHFPNATTIPSIKDTKKRHQMTLDAMNEGQSIILQAYLTNGDMLGIIDFLELVEPGLGTKTGYTYRVGEIKSAGSLSTAHVMQAAWYTELVHNVQGLSLQKARFFVKNEKEEIIDLSVIEDEYKETKGELLRLRLSNKPPGPFLIKACSSCRWRGVCMPDLIARRHFSLLPHINRVHVKQLNANGVFRWDELNSSNVHLLTAIGLSNYETELIINALSCLNNDCPPSFYPLRKNLLEDLCVVVPEIPELSSQRKAGAGLKVASLCYEGLNNKPEKIEVAFSNNIMKADLTPLACKKRLAFYGSTDLGSFQQVADHNKFKLQKNIDIFEIVDNILHIPVPGTELDVLYGYISGKESTMLSAEQRVQAVREVINWVAKSI